MKRLDFIKIFGLAWVPVRFFPEKDSGKLIYKNFIAGYQYYEGELTEHFFQKNDKLIMKREPHNKFDNNAIEIFWRKYKLGYIPRKDNVILAKMLDESFILETRISHFIPENNTWERLEISVYAKN